MKRAFALAAGLVSISVAAWAAAAQRVDWPSYGGQADEAGYAAIAQIDRSNVQRLGLDWSLDLPGEQALEATPLSVDGVLYFTGSYADVYAVSVETGDLLWKHAARVFEHNSRKMKHLVAQPQLKREAVAYILAGIEAGHLRPVIDRCFELSEIAEAYHHLLSNKQVGKIVVKARP